jgi:hypothetical protein
MERPINNGVVIYHLNNISWIKKRRRYEVYVKRNGINFIRKYFKNIEDAVAFRDHFYDTNLSPLPETL